MSVITHREPVGITVTVHGYTTYVVGVMRNLEK